MSNNDSQRVNITHFPFFMKNYSSSFITMLHNWSREREGQSRISDL